MIRRIQNWFRWDGRAEFDRDRADLLARWFAEAAASGRPRGLIWKRWTITGGSTFGKGMAIVPVELEFEPIPDGPLSDVPQAREPRPALVLFRRTRSSWHAEPRALFNVSVDVVLRE